MKLDWRGGRPLTLRELIMKSNFETMIKYIIAFDKKMVGLEEMVRCEQRSLTET